MFKKAKIYKAIISIYASFLILPSDEQRIP